MAKKAGPDIHSRATHQSSLVDFPIVIPITVRWGDMDAYAHVNNTTYFRYFEQARMAYFDTTIPAGDSATGAGPILHSTSCRFRAPVTYPDSLHVGVRVSELSDDRFTMVYRIFSEHLDRIAAEGEAIVVAYDYDSHAKATVPSAWVEAIEELEGRRVRDND